MRYANKTTSLKTIYLKDGSGIFLRRGESVEVAPSKILRMSKGVVEITDESVPMKSRKSRSKTKETEETVSEENF